MKTQTTVRSTDGERAFEAYKRKHKFAFRLMAEYAADDGHSNDKPSPILNAGSMDELADNLQTIYELAACSIFIDELWSEVREFEKQRRNRIGR